MSKLDARLFLVGQIVTLWIDCEGGLGLSRTYDVFAGVLRLRLKRGSGT